MNPGTYCGGISINGNNNVTMNPGIYYMYGGGFDILSAATTITGYGVLIYNTDGHGIAGLPTSNYRGVNIGGNVSPNFSGTIYLPGDALTLQGGSGFTVGSNVPAVIADTLSVGGGSFVIQSGSGSGQYKFAALVQ